MAETEAYAKLLRDTRWREFRQEVLRLDRNTCGHCGRESEGLHVHHREYIEGRLPWEYPLSSLETLCARCHAAEHGIVPPPLGWEVASYDDLEDLSGRCEVCATELRHVFLVYHRAWGYLNVGTDCCDRMTGSPVGSDIERSLARRARFVDSPRWHTTRRGVSRRLGGIRVTVYRAGAGHKVAMSWHGVAVHGRVLYRSENAARGAAFDALDSGAAHRCLSVALTGVPHG